MFKELAPYLRQRAVLVTVAHLGEDQIRVNVVPQKIKDGENAALTTPLTVTGTAEDLDRDLAATLVSFVASHMELKNTLDRAKEEMDAAAKAAQAEARSKSKNSGAKPAAKVEEPAGASKPVPKPQPEPPREGSLFDAPVAVDVPGDRAEEEEEVGAEMSEDDGAGDGGGFDETA
jgi:PRTRC genetic system protein E